MIPTFSLVAGCHSAVGLQVDVVLAEEVSGDLIAVLADGRQHHVFAAEPDDPLSITDVEAFVGKADIVDVIERVAHQELPEGHDNFSLRVYLNESVVHITELVVMHCRERSHDG